MLLVICHRTRVQSQGASLLSRAMLLLPLAHASEIRSALAVGPLTISKIRLMRLLTWQGARP